MNEARNIAKMIRPTEKTIGKYTFYIYPLPAFEAAALSTEVAGLFAPLFGGIAEAFQDSTNGSTEEKKSFMDMDISKAAPYIANAFSSLSSAKVEHLIRCLLLDNHVAVCEAEVSEAEYLTEDKCNEVFRGNVQNMFVLAFYVLMENYGDFFGNIGSQSGSAVESLKQMMSPGMAHLT